MILKTEKKRARRGTVGRLIGTICSFYPVLVPLALFCIIFSAAVGAVPSLFMQKVIAGIEDCLQSDYGDDYAGDAQKTESQDVRPDGDLAGQIL